MTSLRERSHIILWTLLFFFVASMTVGGLVGGANILTVLLGQKNTALYVGTIDDKSVTRQEYEYEQRIQINRTVTNGGEINDQTVISAGNSAWNIIVENYIKEQKIEELNLTVYPDEVYDFLIQSPPVAFQNNVTDAGFFIDDEGEFDLFEFQDALRSGNFPNELKDLALLWENYLKSWLADRKLRNIYNTLGSISDTEVRNDYIRKNTDVTIDYIYINPSQLPDSLFEISDSEINDKYDEIKDERYKKEKNKSVEYILFAFPKIDEDSLQYSIEKDSIMNQAFLVSDEAKYTNFESAAKMYNVNIEDTLNIIEQLSGNSGIPYQMGNSRKVVRFVFDSDINSVSEPIEMKNGIAVFHTINDNPGGYKSIEDVKETLRKTIIRSKQKEMAKVLLSEAVSKSNFDGWSTIAEQNTYFSIVQNQEGKINASFEEVGKSSELEGALISLDIDNASNIIETPTCYLYLKVKEKSIFSEEDYESKSEGIKSQLQSSRKNSGYFKWLNARKNELEIDDWRYLIY